MQCPWCREHFNEDREGSTTPITTSSPLRWWVFHWVCPACQKWTADLVLIKTEPHRFATGSPGPSGTESQRFRIQPFGGSRAPAPPEVPKPLASDYNEAGAVLEVSPKSAAALARRCLQHLLRDYAKTTTRDLFDQIEEVMPSLPPRLAEDLDAVRQVGNFAAHPQKNTATGEILDVEPHEAEWTLDALAELFEHYFVQPARSKARRDALDAKLTDAGKPILRRGDSTTS